MDAIRVSHLSKMYRVYARPADMLWEMLTRKPRHKEFWALRDVSLEVARGEVVGVIGRNGAGKSTLLKILAGTLDKTAGQVEIHGRMSAILELGTGFHPEYSGRENIYMGGLCLGMSRQEIDRKLHEIVDFSELGEVIDQPFKTYSSGMQARLAFSVAISVEPDNLIIDEALAAGDMLFTAKCYQKMHDIARSGTTVFFVTHNLSTIYELCTAAVLLHRGRMVTMGAPRRVGYEYERLLSEERERMLATRPSPASPARGAEKRDERAKIARIEDVFITDARGVRRETLVFGEEYTTVVRCRFLERCPGANVAFRIQNPLGATITGDNTLFQDLFISGEPGDVVDVCFRSRCKLTRGTYILGAGVTQPLSLDYPRGQYVALDKVNECVVFQVTNDTPYSGYFSMDSQISIVRQAGRERAQEDVAGKEEIAA